MHLLRSVYAALLLPVMAVAAPLHHELELGFEPAAGRLRAVDHVTLTPDAGRCFTLRAGLAPALPDGVLTALDSGDGFERFCLPAAGERFTLRYAGALMAAGEASPISARGISLDPGDGWYPLFGQALIRFELRVELPDGWRSISQGKRLRRLQESDRVIESWRETRAQQGIFLVAAAFDEYRGQVGAVATLALLRRPAPELARRYLDAGARYLRLYSELLGPYPYAKFALVENTWDSGFGMPSFTLLGPRVIRLPFIVDTSYPHEILHNWWGNGVYIDAAGGNWSEGLTTYLADYLLAERQGRGAEYRRNALQRYADYARDSAEQPLARFRARHDGLSQAIGYDKSLMMFHSLRRRLGDERFVAALRRFYRQHRFQRAGYDELRATFEAVGGQPLEVEFDQWLNRSGAPELAVADVDADGRRLIATLHQTQEGPAYRLRVPLAVQLADREQAWQTELTMTEKRQFIRLDLPARPERLAVDPQFDLLRMLAPQEVPPALNQILGAGRQRIVLPAAADPSLQRVYRQVADAWGLATVMDTTLASLPADTGLWLFGRDNRWRDTLLAQLACQDVELTDERLVIAGESLDPATTGMVLVARHPDDPNRALALVIADDSGLFRTMAGKLRHYGRYSYLAFRGSEADNVLKGQWPVEHSPLNIGTGAEAPPWRARLRSQPPLVAQGSSSGAG